MALTKIKTSGIADNAITNAKMADDAINSDDFADGSIDNVHVATGLDAVKLADGTVTNTEFQYINTLSSNAQTQISAALPKAGGTMSGNIAMGGGDISGGGTITGTFVGGITGNVTGNTSGTALTVTQAAQTAITSVGSLTGLTIDGLLTVNPRLSSFAEGGILIDAGSDDTIPTLHLKNTTNGLNVVIRLQNGNQDWKIGSSISYGNNFDIKDVTAGTTPFTIAEGTGNVGIGGTPDSTAQLHLQKSSDPTLVLSDTTANQNYYIGIDSSATGDPLMIGTGKVVGTATKITMDSSGNVGIGTTSPGQNLSVHAVTGHSYTRLSSGATDSAGILEIMNSATSGMAFLSYGATATGTFFGLNRAGRSFGTFDLETAFGTYSANSFHLGANSTIALTLDSSQNATFAGKVGVGVSPTQQLEIAGDVRIQDARSLFFKRHGDNYAWRIRNESSSDGSTYGFNGSNDLVFEVVSNSQTVATPAVASHTVYANTANTLVLKETGNVEFGGSATFAGDVLLSGNNKFGSTSSYIRANPTASDLVIYGGNSSAGDIQIFGRRYIYFFDIDDGNANRFQFDTSNGNATFAGTVTGTSFYVGVSNQIRMPQTDGNRYGAILVDQTAGSGQGTAQSLRIISKNDYGSIYNQRITMETAGSERFVVEYNGVCSGDLNDTSDVSLKKTIQPIESSLNIIKKLNPVSFYWKKGEFRGEDKQKGFIAQEVESIIPEVVHGEDGNKSINVTGIVAQLTKAMQELSDKVTALENA